jgi:hypothetical protein
MAKAGKDLSNETEATLFEMFDYFCSKMNFAKSYMDSISICCMNRLFLELRKQTDKIKIS